MVGPSVEAHRTPYRSVSGKEAALKKAFGKRDREFERLLVVIRSQLGLDVVHDHPKRNPIALSEADQFIEKLGCIHTTPTREVAAR